MGEDVQHPCIHRLFAQIGDNYFIFTKNWEVFITLVHLGKFSDFNERL